MDGSIEIIDLMIVSLLVMRLSIFERNKSV
jgi:hypothetical protein